MQNAHISRLSISPKEWVVEFVDASGEVKFTVELLILSAKQDIDADVRLFVCPLTQRGKNKL